jgi:hypothetical protein
VPPATSQKLETIEVQISLAAIGKASPAYHQPEAGNNRSHNQPGSSRQSKCRLPPAGSRGYLKFFQLPTADKIPATSRQPEAGKGKKKTQVKIYLPCRGPAH